MKRKYWTNMSSAKKKPTPPKPDETDEILAEILESEGVVPKRSLVNKLLLFWVKSGSEAQQEGIRIGRHVSKKIQEDLNGH